MVRFFKPTGLLAIALLFFLISCSGAPQVIFSLPPVDLDQLVADYATLTKVTKTPHRFSSMYVMTLCRLPTELEAQMVQSPHSKANDASAEFASVLLNVYVTAESEAIFRRIGQSEDKLVFPAGTAIVKEKISEPGMTVDALGIMIKREAGFNPAGNDWEYAYWEAGKLTRDPALLQTCQDCHLSQSQSDSVFGLDKYGSEYPYSESNS